MRVNKLKFIGIVLLTFIHSSTAFALIDTAWPNGRPPAHAFDPGPSQNPDNLVARELIELNAAIPFFPGISERVLRYTFDERERDPDKKIDSWGPTQKFRPAFGPIPWRMILQPNSVKILFIGQDGTHIAEAAGRPATASFGGRAQSLAKHFGVDYSAGFINTYAFTIKGQYSAYGAPFLLDGKVKKSSIVPTDIWLMSQDPSSPIVKWRNSLIEWIINNNRESLKLIVLFGGSAQDSIASFIESRGGKVGSRYMNDMGRVQVPEFKLVPAGGNNETPIALDANGNELKRNNPEHMVFTHAGPYKNGLLHHAQLGGFDLNYIYAEKSNRLPSRSIKGLNIKGGPIESDILVTSLPHPTSLSHTLNDTAIAYWEEQLAKDPTYLELLEKAGGKIDSYRKRDFFGKVFSAMPDAKRASKIRSEGFERGAEAVAAVVARDLRKLDDFKDTGWKIKPDYSESGKMMSNDYDLGLPYDYGREEIHNVNYDFGTPANRMVSSSSAQRLGAQVIVIGERGVPRHDKEKLSDMKYQQPNQELNPDEMFTSRTRVKESRYTYDPGPSEKYAKLMKNLDFSAIYATKTDPESGRKMSFSRDGINAYNVKTHPSVGDFAHYRGTFKNPRVVIMADPDGVDGLITARALTGTRGQYLQGLMNDLGVGDQYLVLKTVPFGMDEASEEEWQAVLDATQNEKGDYRGDLVAEILNDNRPELFIADGKYAARELRRILKSLGSELPIIEVHRNGTSNSYGISAAAERILNSVKSLKATALVSNIEARMDNIPKSHLTYYARVWEGTSGDRVLSADDHLKGKAFLEVAPAWAAFHDAKLLPETKEAIDKMLQKMEDLGFPRPEEKLPEYLKRKEQEAAPAAA